MKCLSLTGCLSSSPPLTFCPLFLVLLINHLDSFCSSCTILLVSGIFYFSLAKINSAFCEVSCSSRNNHACVCDMSLFCARWPWIPSLAIFLGSSSKLMSCSNISVSGFILLSVHIGWVCSVLLWHVVCTLKFLGSKIVNCFSGGGNMQERCWISWPGQCITSAGIWKTNPLFPGMRNEFIKGTEGSQGRLEEWVRELSASWRDAMHADESRGETNLWQRACFPTRYFRWTSALWITTDTRNTGCLSIAQIHSSQAKHSQF